MPPGTGICRRVFRAHLALVATGLLISLDLVFRGRQPSLPEVEEENTNAGQYPVIFQPQRMRRSIGSPAL